MRLETRKINKPPFELQKELYERLHHRYYVEQDKKLRLDANKQWNFSNYMNRLKYGLMGWQGFINFAEQCGEKIEINLP